MYNLIFYSGGKKKSRGVDGELEDGGDVEVEAENEGVAAAIAQPRRRRRLKDNVAEEDFFEIDNKSGLAGKPLFKKFNGVGTSVG